MYGVKAMVTNKPNLLETKAVWSWKSTHYQYESQKFRRDILLARKGHFGYNHSLLVFGQVARSVDPASIQTFVTVSLSHLMLILLKGETHEYEYSGIWTQRQR